MRPSEAGAVLIKGGTEPKPDLLWNLNCKTWALSTPTPVTVRGGDEEERQSGGQQAAPVLLRGTREGT